jgi:hypothetical protein
MDSTLGGHQHDGDAIAHLLPVRGIGCAAIHWVLLLVFVEGISDLWSTMFL